MQEIENRMLVDSEWPGNLIYAEIPQCECCGDEIKQYMALRILSGKKRVWICDRCIEDMKEVTGW